jgi:hypothetical protein
MVEKQLISQHLHKTFDFWKKVLILDFHHGMNIVFFLVLGVFAKSAR